MNVHHWVYIQITKYIADCFRNEVNRMTNKYLLMKEKMSFFLYIVVTILQFVPMMKVNSRNYNIFQFYSYLKSAGVNGISETARENWQEIFGNIDIMIFSVKILFAVVIILLLLNLVYIGSILCKRRINLNYIIMFVTVIYACIHSIFLANLCENILGILYPVFILIIEFGEFFFSKIEMKEIK